MPLVRALAERVPARVSGGLWHPLAGFDLVAHQEAREDAAAHGYLRVVVDGSGDSYASTVVFRLVPSRA